MPSSLPLACRYVIISPIKDEARHIELTLTSVTQQTVKPVQWVIVDDGSKDDTAAIVQRYAEQHSFIRLIRTPTAGVRKTGSAEVLAFYRGYQSLDDAGFDFIVKLDGDLSFKPDYFEKLFHRFLLDTRLGIASGVYLEPDKSGVWTPVVMPSYHAFGACKVVRRECFDEIGGFEATPGWDTADEIRAMNRCWHTGHFTDLEVKHHKPEGSGMGYLRTSAMHGEIHYVTGGDPWFLLFKILHRATSRPFILSALALFWGYVRAIAKGTPRLVTAAEAGSYRELLRRRMWLRAKSLFPSRVGSGH